MTYFKPCPKCQTGTLRISGDQWGDYLRCINCGLTSSLPENCRTRQQIRNELIRLHRDFAAAGTSTGIAASSASGTTTAVAA